MKYTVQSSKYTLKNFIYLLPFAILPAWFLSLSTDQEAIFCALEAIVHGRINDFHFVHIFRAISILNFYDWYSVVFGIAGVIMMIVCGAMLMAFLDKHMRIGKRTFTGIFSKLNDNLVSTAGYVMLLLAIYELWSLLTSAFVYVFSLIPVVWLAYVFAIMVYLSMHVVLIYFIGKIYLWLPCMQITGFKAKEALYYSNNLNTPVKRRIVAGQLLFLFIAYSSIFLCAWFAVSFVWFTVLTTILYYFLIMLYCVRMQIVYFDRDNIDRADLLGYYRR